MAGARQLHLFRSRRQRGVEPPAPKEFALHCAIADTLRRWAMPDWLWCHYPAGEERTAAAGARLKRLGTMPGFPDLIFIPPLGHKNQRPAFLEIKRRNGRLSNAQAAFAEWCRVNQCPFEIADTYEKAIAILQDWGALKTTVKVQ